MEGGREGESREGYGGYKEGARGREDIERVVSWAGRPYLFN